MPINTDALSIIALPLMSLYQDHIVPRDNNEYNIIFSWQNMKGD